MKCFVVAWLSVVLLISCQPPAQDVKETRFLLGTIVEFTVYTGREKQALKAIAEAAAEMQQVENTFTIFGDVENSVKRFNRAKVGQVVKLDDEVEQLLLQSIQINQQTKGAFDPTLGALNQLWGFSGEKLKQQPPSSQDIQQALQKTGVQNIQQQNGGWVKKVHGLQLDFGAIAKGYAIDKGTEILKQYGFSQAIINAGGDMMVLGSHGDKPWRIAIRHPRQKQPLGWLEVNSNMSIVTSGDYERFYIYEGQRYHHILNPQTGYPAMNKLSITVVASGVSLADAWSTGLFVQDGKEAFRTLKAHRDIHALWLLSDGKVLLSRDMNKFIHIE